MRSPVVASSYTIDSEKPQNLDGPIGQKSNNDFVAKDLLRMVQEYVHQKVWLSTFAGLKTQRLGCHRKSCAIHKSIAAFSTATP